mgnify:CR=1 FL=1
MKYSSSDFGLSVRQRVNEVDKNTIKNLDEVRRLLEKEAVLVNRTSLQQKQGSSIPPKAFPEALVRKGYSDHNPEVAEE